MPALRNLIGVDIGGTKIAVAAVSPAGVILARSSFATEAGRGFSRAVDRLVTAIEQVDREASVAAASLDADSPETSQGSFLPVPGIGIGCAGPVDPLAGLINNPYTLTGWDRCNIVRPLADRFGVKVRLENDADAAALGECWVGAGQGVFPVSMLTFGTGVGGATVLASGVFRGANGEHPELGHLQVEPNGPECYCGFRGCLESIASGTAIGTFGKQIGIESTPAVFQAARAGDPRAAAIVGRAAQAAATAAWTLFHTLLPRRLILGGGMMETQFETFAGPIRDRIGRATQFSPGGVEIVPARLGNDAGVIGAAAWVVS